MKLLLLFRILCFVFLIACNVCAAVSLEEKRAMLLDGGPSGEELAALTQRLSVLRPLLQAKMDQVGQLCAEERPEEEYKAVVEEARALQKEIRELHLRWHHIVVQKVRQQGEDFGIWNPQDTTLAKVVMEYGTGEYMYIVPPEVANIKLSVQAGLPVPRDSWSEVLEILLLQNGVGIKPVNAYARQLFLLKQDPTFVTHIVSSPGGLEALSGHERIFYLFVPPVEKVRGVITFLEKFADPKISFVHQIGNRVGVVSSKAEIQKLLGLYKAVWSEKEIGKVTRVIPVKKMHAKEMEKILQGFFGVSAQNRTPVHPVAARNGQAPLRGSEEEITVFASSAGNSLILVGDTDVVSRAEKIVFETEKQYEDPSEMTIYMYTCQHSDPVDLAKTLDRLYLSFLGAGQKVENTEYNFQGRGFRGDYPLPVPPQPFKPEISAKVEIDQGSERFIPDQKTSSLLMVIRRDTLNPIKEIIKRLDVPKKMVQIEVLLFEKKLNAQTQCGLNLLKIGSNAHNGARYDGARLSNLQEGTASPAGEGILAFFLQQPSKDSFPAFDLAYSFLMSREDIQLNAAPSVITVNQTPATISIVEELSLNNGAVPIESKGGAIFEQSFTRAQYGIQLILTPIVHIDEQEPKNNSITLKSNVTFDTIRPSVGKEQDRPPVDKRHIENEVRVADGETVILGGLRRRSAHEQQEKVPFLGDLPCLGKLFGFTALTDNNTEMLFFITPKIILDPKEELLLLRCKELSKRPGDIPEFLECLEYAHEYEKRCYFSRSVQLLFDS